MNLDLSTSLGSFERRGMGSCPHDTFETVFFMHRVAFDVAPVSVALGIARAIMQKTIMTRSRPYDVA